MHAKMAASMWITELEKFMKGEDNSGVSSVSKGEAARSNTTMFQC